MSSRNKSKSSTKNGPKKPSPTAQILEHVELLIALHEEQSESSPSAIGSDPTILVDDIAQKLESQFGKRFDAVEERIASSQSKLGEGSSNGNDSAIGSLVERFDAIESKLAAIEDKLENAADHDGTDSQTQERLESLDRQLEKVAAAIAGQQQLIENQAPSTDATSFISSFQDQFTEVLSQMKAELAGVTQAGAVASSDQQPEDDSEASPSKPDWDRQKKAMLSKYGIDPKHRPSMATPSIESDPVLETIMADKELSSSIELPVGEVISDDPEEIQRIKKDLNLKLRDAEVEISIERAKLSQLHAELESKQLELERRDLQLTEKYQVRENTAGADDDQAGLLDRLKKHLTKRDRKNLDRI